MDQHFSAFVRLPFSLGGKLLGATFALVLGGCPSPAVTTDAGPVDTGPPPLSYDSSDETVDVGVTPRTYVLAQPQTLPDAALPVVFVFHGDGGNGRGMQGAFDFEHRSVEPMLYVYPNAPGGTFPYWSSEGREGEAAFVRAALDALDARFDIDRGRVYLTGMSGGATLSNALACRLGPDVIRAIAAHSGTLYPVDDDFMYTPTGGVSCTMLDVMLLWGTEDRAAGVSYEQGEAVRENYRRTAECGEASPWSRYDACVSYAGCEVVWCSIGGLGHSVWPGAGDAILTYFTSRR